MRRQYAKIGSAPVQIGEELLPYHYIKEHFVVQRGKHVRHDTDLLAKRIFEVYMGDHKKAV